MNYPNSQKIKKYLTTSTIGNNILCEDEVDSTNSLGKKMALLGMPHGTVIICREQTHGRGRQDRVWLSDPEDSLCMSVILRPDIETQLLTRYSTALAVAVCRALRGFDVPCMIKWPNDILACEKKLCGMLIEGGVHSDGKSFLVCGVGVNVNQEFTMTDDSYLKTADLSEVKDIFNVATSIFNFRHCKTEREEVSARILNELEKAIECCTDDVMYSALLSEYAEYSCVLGRKVRVLEGKNIFYGVAKSLDELGRIVLLSDDGNTMCFNSGDVSVRY